MYGSVNNIPPHSPIGQNINIFIIMLHYKLTSDIIMTIWVLGLLVFPFQPRFAYYIQGLLISGFLLLSIYPKLPFLG